MCGRINQSKSVKHYAQNLGFETREYSTELQTPIGDYNACPGVPHWTLRLLDDTLLPEQIRWFYLSDYAKRNNFRPTTNAQLTKLLSPYYRTLMQNGRVIVPVDGWYEWKDGQPQYIRPKDGKPLFLASLTNHYPGKEDPEGAGYVVITDDSKQGMVDVHEKRPMALCAEDARDWMDLSLNYEQAENMVRTRAINEDAFEWHKVSRDVGNVNIHEAYLIEPVAAEPEQANLF